MDSTRWRNVTLARESYLGRTAHTGGLPLQAYLEVSSRCNLRCAMCAINYDTRHDARSERPVFLEPELFARLRPIFPSLLDAKLFGLGEPLLNPHLVSYARELATAGVHVSFHTNGTLIDDAKARALARAGVSHITVSIDGATKETYEAIRRGASFERVLRGIRALTAAAHMYGRPSVDLAMVAMASNIGEVPLLVELAAECGASGMHIEPLLAQTGSAELDEHYRRENLGTLPAERVASAFERAASIAHERGLRFGTRFDPSSAHFDYTGTPAPSWMCSEPWATILVTSAGEVRACCLNDLVFGNLREQTIEEIWDGAAYVRFREQHARATMADGCANCVRNGRVQGSTWFRATEAVTMRPIVDGLPPVSSDALTIDAVTPALRISGRMQRGVDRSAVQVMIDHTPVETLVHAAVNRNTYTIPLPTHFLTEGAHIVWLRHKDGRALAQREVHFRRE